MENFLAFLEASKNVLVRLNTFRKTIPLERKQIHITLGNESCDLDSLISSLTLGYFLSKQDLQTTVIPVLNVSKENFFLRTENCFVLEEAGVPLENLVFRNDINFKDLISKNTVTASLVDHHILSSKDEILSDCVRQVFDHRPIDPSYKWNEKLVQIKIEQVGSCCTLIANEIIKTKDEILSKPLAYLLYQTIIYDTIALKPEHGRTKPLDIKIGTKLEEKFGFNEDRQVLFDKLWAAHNDISHLTVNQLLYKDLKVVEGLFIPGLPMLVEDFLKKENAYMSVVQFACDHKVTCIVLVGLDASSGQVRRDIALYATTKEDRIKEALLNIFRTNKEYDFQFEDRSCCFSDNIVLLHMHNTKLSRKQLVPLAKEAIKKCTNC